MDETTENPVRPPAAEAGVPRVPATPEQRRVVRWFFFGVFAFLIYQLMLVLSLFSDIIIWAVSLTLVCFPIHASMRRRIPGRKDAAATLSTLVVLLLILVPTLSITAIVLQQSAQLYPTVRAWVGALQSADGAGVSGVLPEFLRAYLQRIVDFAGQSTVLSQFDLQEFMLARINAMSAQIARFGAATARNIVLGLLNLAGILVLMFFCFRDGERLLRWLFDMVPMPVAQAQAIALRIYGTVTAVVRGALLTAAMQGVLAMLGYLIAGVPLAVFFGVLTGIAAMIPVVGAALVWAPIGAFVFQQAPAWGIFVLVWGFFVVSLVDNFLKPVLIGTRARMPILLVFFGIIGGVNVYGITGVMIGPILVASVLAFATIYREYYAPPDPGRASGGAGD